MSLSKPSTKKGNGKAKRPTPSTATSGAPVSNALDGRSISQSYTVTSLRDALFCAKVWDASDGTALHEQFLRDLKETTVMEGICDFLNSLLVVMPAELELSPLATLQYMLPFLESELRLGYSRYNFYVHDREAWMVGKACQIETVKRLIENMVLAGDQEGFGKVLREGLTACVEQQYASLVAPRTAARNMAKTTHGGLATLADAGESQGYSSSAPNRRATFNSQEADRSGCQVVPVPGMRPMVTVPFDIGPASEPYASALCAFATNAAHNMVHTKKQVSLLTGAAQTVSDKAFQKGAKKARFGAYKYTPGFFLRDQPSRRKVVFYPDQAGEGLSLDVLDTSLDGPELDEDADDPSGEFDSDEEPLFGFDTTEWHSPIKPGNLSVNGRGYTSSATQATRGRGNNRGPYSSSFFAGVDPEVSAPFEESISAFLDGVMSGTKTAEVSPKVDSSDCATSHAPTLVELLIPYLEKVCASRAGKVDTDLNGASDIGVVSPDLAGGSGDTATSSVDVPENQDLTPASPSRGSPKKKIGGGKRRGVSTRAANVSVGARGISHSAYRFRGSNRS